MSTAKSLSGAFIALMAAAILLVGGVASAATITNIKFDNGQTTTQCTAGQTVNAVVRMNIPVGEVAELSQSDVIGDNLAPALPVSLGGQNGLEEGQQDVNVTFPCPPNTGTYTVEVRTAGIYGGQRAVNITDGVVTVQSFAGALRVVSSTGTVGGSGNATIDSLMALIKSLQDQIAALTHPTTPVKPTYCNGFISYNGSNAWSVQTWLLARPQFNGPFHAIGVYEATGNWKSASQASYSMAVAECQ